MPAIWESTSALDSQERLLYITTMNAIEIAQKVSAERQAVYIRESKTVSGQYDIRDLESGTKKGWTIMDGYTASAIVAVYSALNEANKIIYAALPLNKMATVAFKLMK